MKQVMLFITVLLCMSCGNNDPYPYTFHSIKNYRGTEVYKLAKHVRDNDTIAMLEFMKENPSVSVDTKDKYFGYSLLMWAIYNGKYDAFHCLLNHGANPNFQGTYHQETPMRQAAHFFGRNYESDSRYIEELLEHGAVPQLKDLIAAVSNDLTYTKLLVESGMDYNARYEGENSAAEWAIIYRQPKIAEYLIIYKKAVLYEEPFFKGWYLGDPMFAASKKRIEEYLNKHPEQLLYLDKESHQKGMSDGETKNKKF